jgi:hypothetical protein
MMQFGDGIWTVPAPLRYCGLLFNTRMTVCRLSDGGLVVIAPIRGSEDLTASIDALGPVRAIITPNLMHHLYVGEWMEAYPDAMSYGPPGLAAKRPDLAFSHQLGPELDDVLGDDLLHFPIAGIPKLNESVFVHRQSRTLIATDLCFFMPKATGLTGLFASLTGIKKRPRCEPSVRILIQDKGAFRASLQPLRAMAFQHLSMCHDSVLSTGATEAIQGVLDQLSVPSDSKQDTCPPESRPMV